jgi:hypothetical protein
MNQLGRIFANVLRDVSRQKEEVSKTNLPVGMVKAILRAKIRRRKEEIENAKGIRGMR